MMDKICRGSLIGEAYSQGYVIDGLADTSRTAKGTHVTHTSMKVFHQVNSAKNLHHPRGTNDTFKESGWFRHDDMAPYSSDVSYLSPRFTKSGGGKLPARPPADTAAGLGRATSRKNISFDKAPETVDITPSEDSYAMRSPRLANGHQSPRAADGNEESKPRKTFLEFSNKNRRGVVRCQSDGTLDRPRRMEALLSPRYPQDDHGLEAAWKSSPERHSPTYRMSANWVAWSSGENPASEGSSGKVTMPSRNFSSHTRIPQSGRRTEMSQTSHEHPTASYISNCEDYKPSKGIRCNILKDDDNARRRLQLDPTQSERNLIKERKHAFPDDPLTQYQKDQLRTVSSNGAKGSHEPNRHMVDIQHRTSAEMAASFRSAEKPERHNEESFCAGGPRGRKGGTECRQSIQDRSEQIKAEVSGYVQMPVRRGLRDHRNSDVVKEHLQPTPASTLPIAPVINPTQLNWPPPEREIGRRAAGGRVNSSSSVVSSNQPQDLVNVPERSMVTEVRALKPAGYSPYLSRVVVSSHPR
eukprot:gnl/TRDRNA2_/TRDRNA2_195920_c0_seq1.p1 gnl/TRDRNA2_/TRDRNA2_195920_c0~~gnl/TRDRNA2_/TRDRNA2_195920_c0_seq1.p1  ORF type:complete len:539 (-),score=52.91 gnl/TRDRNA2_/TRDRNA2_195920_c0_seq1:91-1668(-)